MADIIIAFPKIEDAKNLRRILNKNGHDVTLVCDSGAQIVSAANSLDGGIVICGYRFSDMHYSEIYEYLPKGFRCYCWPFTGKTGRLRCARSDGTTDAL